MKIEALDVILNPQRHYNKLAEKVANLNLSNDALLLKLDGYRHRRRNTTIITSLATVAASAIAITIAQHFGTTTGALSAGPVALGACYTGITRNIIRENEQVILEEELAKRPQPNVLHNQSLPNTLKNTSAPNVLK